MTPVSHQYAQVNRQTEEVTAWFLQPEPPAESEEVRYERIPMTTFLNGAAPPPSPTHRLYFIGNANVAWRDSLPLADQLAKHLAKTYTDVDAVYLAAVGSRTKEYEEAEAAARAYMAAETKPMVVSDFITSHAEHNPEGEVKTNEWAAQSIIERADAFKWAVRQMRSVRASSQAAMRAATTDAELAQAVTEWNDFIAWLRGVLDLPPATS